MNLREIAATIDKTKENEAYVSSYDIAEALGIHDFYGEEQDRLKAYWIGRWYCTDTHVGFRLYFMDQEPVAFSEQIGRKYPEEFYWVSVDAFTKVRDYIISLNTPEKEYINHIDFDKDVGNSYKIDFTAEVMDWNTARYHGQPIEFLERIKDTPDYGIDTKIRIRIPQSGEELVTDVRDLDFVFHVSHELSREKTGETLSDKIQSAAGRAGESQASGHTPHHTR